jgi:hypothetical protein
MATLASTPKLSLEAAMFNFEPISTTNIISIVQVIVVILGFYFSWKTLDATRTNIGLATLSLDATRTNIGLATQSLDATRTNIGLATQNAQAQLYNNMLIQGRELQLKFMDNLIPKDERQKFFMGIIIAYYASCFELRRVLSLPESAVKLLDNDVKESMREAPFRARFEELRNLHSREFGEYVHGLRGV